MPSLRLRLLDAFEVAIDEQPITKLYSDRTRALLAYLAVEADRPHRRGELATLLWPEVESKKASQNLRQTLRQLQLAIGNKQANPPYLLVTRQTVQFNLAANQWVDVHAVRAGDAMAYRGGLLAQLYVTDSDLFNDWATIQREALHREVLGKLRELGRASAESNTVAQAIIYAQKQVEIDPWREEAYQDWMRFLVADGQSAEAQRVFERCKQVLWDELGVEPSAETQGIIGEDRPQTTDHRPQTVRHSPPTTHDRPPTNLPRGKAPLIGRKAELQEVGDLLATPECRWLTLVGLGGTGKTRLAVAAAEQLVEQSSDYSDGVWFVSLVGASDMLAIATALGFPFQNNESPRIQLQNHLRDKQLLLLLDNCEALLNEGDWLTDLLSAAQNVKILSTSRQSFDQADEWVFDVGGLQTTVNERQVTDGLSHSAELFIQAARRAFARFKPDDLVTIETICSIVQGHPLSIELAASWVRLLSVEAISAEISRDLTLFDTNLRHLPQRQRSLRHIFDYTWNTLTPHEQQVMAQLAVFRAPFDRAAASAVANARLLDLLQLINRSLVQRIGDNFRLHEAVRQYAIERLHDERATKLRHASWYAAKTQSWFEGLFRRESATVESEMAADSDNLRAAWQTAVAQREANLLDQMLLGWAEFLRRNGRFQMLQDQLEQACQAKVTHKQLSIKLGAYHAFSQFELGNLSDAAEQMHELLPTLTTLSNPNARGILLGLAAQVFVRGKEPDDLQALLTAELAQAPTSISEMHLLFGLILLTLKHNDFADAEQYAVRELAITRALDFLPGKATAMGHLGKVAFARHDFATAKRHFVAALKFADQVSNQSIKLDMHNAIGDIHMRFRDFEASEREWQTALIIAEKLGVRRLIGRQHNNLGALYAQMGQLDRAVASAQKYLDIATSRQDQFGRATALINLAYMMRDLYQFPRMQTLFFEALETATQINDVYRQIISRYWLSVISIFLADFEQAERHILDALAISEQQDNQTFLLASTFTRLTGWFLRDEATSAETLTEIAQSLLAPLTADSHPNQHVLYYFAHVFIEMRRGQYATALRYLNEARFTHVLKPLQFNRFAGDVLHGWLHWQLGEIETARSSAEAAMSDLANLRPAGEIHTYILWCLLELLHGTNSPHLKVAITHVRRVMTTTEEYITDPVARSRWRNYWLHQHLFTFL